MALDVPENLCILIGLDPSRIHCCAYDTQEHTIPAEEDSGLVGGSACLNVWTGTWMGLIISLRFFNAERMGASHDLEIFA